ncbi:hypothetical protein D6T64_04150 [Cryobacterium melibiosiphilum]|uniref:Uncharacterized protein n=1 Tax=Cryobacterium melibiosiphilum TaxID=995039 RepID=A0A3A5MYZ1_9MICO|nr:hypothetical protein [Cryobacterium melibiosiphilum]RJT90344.1 hypothetical protein D6T64_04150 [Cryobacterium melibiosiphilum]
MSTRPAPRKSSLTGSSPIAPPPPAAAEPTAPAVAEVEHPTPAPKAKSSPAAEPATTGSGKKYPHKVSFYQDAADTARIRGAILHTQVSEGSRSLSQFIDHAVMEKVAALEAKYNGGEPFPAIGARELPQGRPMGE